MNRFITLALATSVLAFGASAVTETRAPQLTPQQMFNNVDTNRDGKIDYNEAKAYVISQGAPRQYVDDIVKDLFAKEDTNKDATISLEEMTKSFQEEEERYRNRNNSNNNNNIASNTNHNSEAHPNVLGPNRPRVETLQSRFAGATTSATDELEDVEEDLEEYYWVDFSADVNSKFCSPELAKEDSCWHKVYYDEANDYFYACVTDENTDETSCYTIRMEAEEEESE